MKTIILNTICTPSFFGSILEEIPEKVARLASELHSQRTQNIAIEVLDPISFSPKQIDGLFYIEGTELIFISIAARNHCTAVYSFRKFENSDLPLDAQKIFDEAHQLEIDEIGHTDFASGRFLGLMSQKLNVLRAGIKTINNSNTNHVFNVLRNIGNALPFLGDVNIQDLVDLAGVQHSKTSGDLAASMFFNQVSDYLAVHPQLAKALYTVVRENMSGANTNLYGATLLGTAMAGQGREATEFALSDAADSECSDRLTDALWMLGRLSHYWEKELDLKDHVQQVLKEMGHHSDANVSLRALQAMSNAAVSQPELIAELLVHAQPNNQKALQVLGDFTFKNLKIIKGHPSLAEILYALTELDTEFTNDFDYVLSRLIENSIHDELVYDSLTTWIVKHYNSKTLDKKLSSCFAQSMMKLSNKLLLDELITRWLVSDERILGAAFRDLIGYLWVHGIKQPIFAKDILDTLNANDLKYLVRRLVGWSFHEEALLSLTFSLLETKDAQQRTFGWVYTLLVTEVGRNYPQATLEAIEEKLNDASPEIKQLLKKIQADLLTYTEAIEQLPIRHEFHPPIPIRIRHAVELKKAREHREAMDKANEKSILQQLCTKIPLKAGTGSFSICKEQVGTINRLGSFSSFISLPAQYIVDPLNDEITKRGLRVAKRGDK